MSVCRHARLEFVLRIVEIDLDSIDQRHTFLMRLNAFGRELGLRRNERDTAVMSLAGF